MSTTFRKKPDGRSEPSGHRRDVRRAVSMGTYFGAIARHPARWLIAALLLLLLAACGHYEVTRNYRVDVTVSYGGQDYAGSAIWQTKFVLDDFITGGTPLHYWSFGEAIPIYIPGYGQIFVMKQAGGTAYQDDLFHECVDGTPDSWKFANELQYFNGICSINMTSRYPRPDIVRVIDDKDPPTLDRISLRNRNTSDPTLSKVILTTTNQPISAGLIEKFPWILDLPKMLAGPWCGVDEDNIITIPFVPEYFSTEVRKC